MTMYLQRTALAVLALMAGSGGRAGLRAQEQLRVDVRFTAPANLVYQLDCVSEAIAVCGRADYAALWAREFLRTAADSQHVEDWRAVRRRYEIELTPKLDGGGVEATVDVHSKFRMASLSAHSVEDLTTRLELLVTPNDWIAIRETLFYFEAPFLAWWEREARPKGEPFVQRAAQVLRHDSVATLIDRFARFYATPFPLSAGVPMQFYYRPDLATTGSSGQQIERYSVVEFFPNESPYQRMDVAIHELCHFFFESRSRAQATALDERFRRSPRAGASAAHNLLNEGLAAAFGNAIVADMMASLNLRPPRKHTPLELYNNPYIDKAGVALSAQLPAQLARRATLDDPSFVEGYIAAIDSAFGAEVTAPALLLNELYLFVDDALGAETRRAVRANIRPGSMYAEQDDPQKATFADFIRQPFLNSLFIVKPTALPILAKKGVIPRHLAVASGRARGALRVERRPSGAWLFLLVASSPKEALQGLVAIAAAKSASAAVGIGASRPKP